jgi:hypothetical protein
MSDGDNRIIMDDVSGEFAVSSDIPNVQLNNVDYKLAEPMECDFWDMDEETCTEVCRLLGYQQCCYECDQINNCESPCDQIDSTNRIVQASTPIPKSQRTLFDDINTGGG